VLITDYPDTDLLENLKWNVEHCCENTTTPAENVSVQGYVWGASLPASMSPGFDLVILADLIFNHSEQEKLIATVRQTLRRKKDATALVFYTPHRPWLMEKDLAFFELARSEGFVVEKLLEEVMEKAMFDNDRGDEITRRTVFGYAFRWPTSMLAE
ncbi:nicotinamide n-methyltransferase, partial [Agyrium rufum]|nr:nicotinamide n-methyltransferase [Agyrium rufum]